MKTSERNRCLRSDIYIYVVRKATRFVGCEGEVVKLEADRREGGGLRSGLNFW